MLPIEIARLSERGFWLGPHLRDATYQTSCGILELILASKDDRQSKQRFCEALMSKYGKPGTITQRILKEYDGLVAEYGLTEMDATAPVEVQQRRLREAIEPHLVGLRRVRRPDESF